MAADTAGPAPPITPEPATPDQDPGEGTSKLARSLIVGLLVLVFIVLAALATVGIGAAAGWRECSTDSVRTTESGKPAGLVYAEHCRPLAVTDPLPLTCLVLAGVLAVPFLLITADTLEFEGFGVKVAATRARRDKKKVASLGDQIVATGQNALATDVELTDAPVMTTPPIDPPEPDVPAEPASP